MNEKNYPSYLDNPKPTRKQTNYERIKSMSIEEVAKSRIEKHIAHNDGGFTYFCGDFNCKDYPQHYFTDLFTYDDEAEKRAIEAEIKWLKSEVKE